MKSGAKFRPGTGVSEGGDQMAEQTALATRDIHALLDRKDVAIELRKALPKHLTAERLIRIAATAIQKSPGLKKCTPLSLLACVVECGQLGLEPDGVLGEIYLVPFKDQATIIVGYKGFAKLAYQTGDIYKITTYVVRKGEKFKYTAGTTAAIVHEPKDHGEEKGDSSWLYAYAIAFFRDGHTDFEVLERAEVFRRRSRSRAYTSGKKDSPWFTDPESMWKKSAVRALATRLPKSTTDNRLARAVALDEMSDAGLLSPTTTGLEISEDALSLNEDSIPAEGPIQPSKEVEKKAAKRDPPAGGSKKAQPPKGGNPAVPRAQIPKGDAIDVKAEKAKPDPFIDRVQLAKIYEVASNSGNMGVDAVREWIKKKYDLKVSELRVSQFHEVVKILTSGE